MAKEYSEKAKKQLMPEATSEEQYVRKLRDTVNSIFTATKKTRDNMQRWRNLFLGDMWNKESDWDFGSKKRSDVQYNTIFAAIQAVAPMVTDNRPITRVSPKFPFLEKLGIALNNVTKYMWQACDVQMKVYQMVIDAMTCGFSIAKVCYNNEKKWGGKIDLSVIDPMDFFLAPGYTDIWEAPFCGVKTQKPMSWIRANFPHIDEVKGCTSDLGEDKTKKTYKFGDVTSVESDTTFVTVYEMWMRDDEAVEEITEEDEYGNETKSKVQKYPYGKTAWFTDEQFLDEKANEEEHGLPPYVVLHNYIRPHDFTGISEVEQIEGLHREVNMMLKYITEYVRRYHAPNQFADADFMSADEIELYKEKSVEGGGVFTFRSQFGQNKQPITPIMEPQLNPAIFNIFSIMPQIIDQVDGITDVTRGQVGKQERQSASEISILLESSSTRTRQRIRNLEWTLKRMYYLILRTVMQYYTRPETMPIQETEGVAYQTYGNSKAQANDIMKPQELPERIQRIKEEGLPITSEEDQKLLDQHKQELDDYQRFLEMFKEYGDLDPIFFDFDIEIQTDSMLPMDKQSRVNTYLRLLQMGGIDPQTVLEYLQIPNTDTIMQRIKELKGGGAEGQQLQQMMQNPQKAAQYFAQLAQQKGGQNG